jgi:ABC-type metal ion transport system substrate-binding protein
MNTIKLKSRLYVIFSAVLALVSLNSCLDNELSTVAEINEDFSNITFVEVDGAFLEVEYQGETGKQDVSLDALLRSNADKRYEIVY